MNLPSPAIVAERGAQRLPRLALLLFCAAYVLPGVFGRDPWRNADLSAFGFMSSLARGQSTWMEPLLGGLRPDGGLLPYWVGALAIKLLPFLDPAQAARLPFGLLLVAVLALVWYSSFHLARTDAAQPVAFAFGGEAHAIDYARALADGALLALIGSLGLLRLGHETTPELLQLLGAALFLYALAVVPFDPRKARLSVVLALPIMAASGAPLVALALGLGGALICRRSSYDSARQFTPWVLTASILALVCALPTHGWAWRLTIDLDTDFPLRLASLLLWFGWPTWPLALWTLWRWRSYWARRHVAVPLLSIAVPLCACVLMNCSDRALMLGLPALAVLASFALPTLSRGVAAMLDWFSVFFFTGVALFAWLYYISMHSSLFPILLANVKKLAEGYQPRFTLLEFLPALLGSLAWLALVRWRTARHQHALWKSLVLPAGGVALGWLLLMSLWLQPLDYARSNRPLVERLQAQLPGPVDCIAAPQQALHLIAALEVHGQWRVDATSALSDTRCSIAVRQVSSTTPIPVPEGWELLSQVRRPTEQRIIYQLLQRSAQPASKVSRSDG
ncbi:hypothetical protein RQP53_01710 [Paucibacter sp. APW11]|uniref:Inner membrane transmembrane protein n=1 Tax=Roseateles aquae TaxID=3077235 RepID=A0ABU3P5X4_9BURK|nr:hypothetical protein [Paucibacter sp. APW11]MDT8997984.1 hypothetical protein [Paucibacter sp. APW11]